MPPRDNPAGARNDSCREAACGLRENDAPRDVPPAAERELFFRVTGTVQGVGFRPFVARLAARLGVRGWVRNDGHGVTIRARARAETLAGFAAALRSEAPPAARVEDLHTGSFDGALPSLPADGFQILESEQAGAPDAAVTPDLALCPECRAELRDPTNRRHGYPFINCTQCGPRYSIVRSLPYDRPRTTMAGFTMCPKCAREYGDPRDRRHHAQPNACPVCGPHVALRDALGATVAERSAAITAAAAALRAGQIVAVKGIGGFHLCVDATDDAAVRELRRRKHREEKPLAVMFESLDAVRAVAAVDDSQAALLASPAAPIVLVRKKPDALLAPSIAPANPWLGALLAYSPLHVELLAAAGRPLVATSGNLSEEPLCTDEAGALARLGGIADLFLVHDRPIARAVDDSVVRTTAAGPIVLRRARGLAPGLLRLPKSPAGSDRLLCVGGHLKNTIAVAAGDRLVLSPHVGDLANAASVDAFRHTVELLGSLYGGGFDRVVCDAHPDYASTHFARVLGLPVVAVQHHLAHILACLLEHDGGPERVLGVSWDGTGYGPDGTIWGGEFIVVDRAARTARRVAHLRPFRLPGGEAAVREPRRAALGLAHAAFGCGDSRPTSLAGEFGFAERESGLLLRALERGTNSPVTTSAGRLFDAVAALLGLRQRCSFEGQAAMELEFAAASAPAEVAPLPLPVTDASGGKPMVDWQPLLEALLTRRGAEPASDLAVAFHDALAGAIVEVARRTGLAHVALTGGCFQNARLLETTSARLHAAGHEVLLHRELPPNDGGLAVGQALGARWGLVDVAP